MDINNIYQLQKIANVKKEKIKDINNPFDDLPFYMDGYLKQNLLTYYNSVKKSNMSFNCLVVGHVGTGKSTIAGQMGYGCDRTFDNSRYYFEPSDFKSYLANKEIKSGVFDEAEEAFDSAENRKFVNHELSRLLQRSRFYNKFNFIVMPDFFSLSKSLAVFHTQAMIRCVFRGNQKENRLQQGEFFYYDYDRKAMLYHKGKDKYNYKAVKPLFWSTFPAWFPGNYEEYNTLKDLSMKKYKVTAVTEQRKGYFTPERIELARQYADFIKQGLKNNQAAIKVGIDPRKGSDMAAIAREMGFLSHTRG